MLCCCRDDEQPHTDGLDIGEHATAADRFAQARAAMRARDAVDRAAQRDAKRAKRVEKKAKRRAAELDADMAGSRVAMLPSGAGGDDSGSGSEYESGGESDADSLEEQQGNVGRRSWDRQAGDGEDGALSLSESNEEFDRTGAGWRFGGGTSDDSDAVQEGADIMLESDADIDLDSDVSGDEAQPPAPRSVSRSRPAGQSKAGAARTAGTAAKKRPEPSHFGMALKRERAPRSNKHAARNVQSLSLVEQEELALRMLSKKA